VYFNPHFSTCLIVNSSFEGVKFLFPMPSEISLPRHESLASEHHTAQQHSNSLGSVALPTLLASTSELLSSDGENHTTARIDSNSKLWLSHPPSTHNCLATLLCFTRQLSLPVSNWQFQMFSLFSPLLPHLLIPNLSLSTLDLSSYSV
jgi:hypothetical protein